MKLTIIGTPRALTGWNRPGQSWGASVAPPGSQWSPVRPDVKPPSVEKSRLLGKPKGARMAFLDFLLHVYLPAIMKVNISAIAKKLPNWKQPKCRSIDEWIKILWYVCTME